MAYFPLFINLEGRRVLVVGGGTIAARRVKTLLEFGCEIDVIAPEIGTDMEVLMDHASVRWMQMEYNRDILKDSEPVFVLAAAVHEVNTMVTEDCRMMSIPVNNASDKAMCDFYFPGIAKDGEVVIGITASGSDHKLAAALTAKIKETIL